VDRSINTKNTLNDNMDNQDPDDEGPVKEHNFNYDQICSTDVMT
jgi:hypothetical protein